MYLWNFTQNILPIHWKMQLYTALKFWERLDLNAQTCFYNVLIRQVSLYRFYYVKTAHRISPFILSLVGKNGIYRHEILWNLPQLSISSIFNPSIGTTVRPWTSIGLWQNIFSNEIDNIHRLKWISSALWHIHFPNHIIDPLQWKGLLAGKNSTYDTPSLSIPQMQALRSGSSVSLLFWM